MLFEYYNRNLQLKKKRENIVLEYPRLFKSMQSNLKIFCSIIIQPPISSLIEGLNENHGRAFS